MARTLEEDGSILSDPRPISAQQRALLALLIDPSFYAAQAARDFANPEEVVEHYLRIGAPCGLKPSATFRSARSVAASPLVRDGEESAFLHYLFDVVGEDALLHAFAGLAPSEMDALRARFDADWYLANAPEPIFADDPFIHYMTSGWRLGHDPSPSFSTNSYLDLYSDIRDCGINPFRHWMCYGISEGRSGGVTSSDPSKLDSWETLSIGQQTILTRIFDLEYYQAGAAESGIRSGPALAMHVSSKSANLSHATPSFRSLKYLAARPELRDTGEIPFLHYLFVTVGEDALRDLFLGHPAETVQAICAHFDTAWYLYSYPDVEESGQDAFIHYMTVGWREQRDPSQEFSTRAYLLRYQDIVDAGVNPFWHWIAYGQAEGRSGASSASNFRSRLYAPLISAILINTDDNPLTPGCAAAVVQQTYAHMEVLVVGAALSEECRTVLHVNERDSAARYLAESGDLPPSRLLERALEHASGELVWILQGSWIHDPEFLARLTSSFADGSVQLGLGRSFEVTDAEYGVSAEELARRMGRWTRHATTPAALWFTRQMQHAVLAPEQYSFLWRRRPLSADVWNEAGAYRALGFWHLYLHMASGGQIATVRDAVIRIPPTSPVAPLDDYSLRVERHRLSAAVQAFWSVAGGTFDSPWAVDKVKRHVLIVTHGIFAGGAENLPIQMANALAGRGVIVSLLIFKADVNPEMRATLNPGVSIYEADWVMEYGCEQFLRDTGCSLIHSHGVISEMFFYRLCEGPLPVPYVATLHGSYEASSSAELPEWFIAKIVRNVDLFVYTADKNLIPLLRNGARAEQMTKMINAMPIDAAPFPRSRAEMGIEENAIVFTLVARGIAEKGWATAINAFKAVQRRNPGRSMHLCLVGEGDEPDRLKPIHANDRSISFLGFQLRINGLYRMTDVAIVPTRFAGESFPLCIIQALQVAVPVIGTDVGEIASMLSVDGVTGGIVVERSSIDHEFDARFTDAMDSLVDDAVRRHLAAGATILAKAYDMDAFTDQYLGVYENVARRFDAARREHAAHQLGQSAVVTA